MEMADTIIVLDNGRVVDINSPTALLHADDCSLKRLGLSEGESFGQEIATEELHQDSRTKTNNNTHDGTCELAVRYWDAVRITEDVQPETPQDHRRKAGDTSIYSYYVASSGYFAVIMYMVSMALWIFCIEFSSKYIVASVTYLQQDIRVADCHFSYLG